MENSDKRGLSQAEAERRLALEGPNALPRAPRRTVWRITLEVLREPMLSLLLAGGLIYLLLGEPSEALVLLAFACLSILITVIQESRTEHVLESLRDLSSPGANVIRDGKKVHIMSQHVVRGDLLLLGEGDRVAADGRLMEAHELQADESLLTGESLPARKSAAPSKREATGEPNVQSIFGGTLIVRGHGLAEVTEIGVHSAIGKIGRQLLGLDVTPPRLQAQTRQMVRVFAGGGALISLSLFVLYGAFRGNWLDGALAAIALGMSMMPEEFPVVLTVFMAMGAWRISKARVLTRRPSAIEALGSATILCTDKTGTLTENRMALAELILPNGACHALGTAIPRRFMPLTNAGALASVSHAVDPMDLAFIREAPKATEGLALLKSFGLKPDLLAVTQIWRAKGKQSLTVAAKGAPEAIIRLCSLAPNQRHQLEKFQHQMASRGLRVLAVATSTCKKVPHLPTELNFKLAGLVGLADPLRPAVPPAVRQCHDAGLRIVMVTGDFPATATAIAASAGIEASRVLTGAQIEEMNSTDLRRAVGTTNVFARILPQQKLRIIEALQANGEVVAMTGDGVNDALSLKAADIGIAMGGRGTDVAREASAIVLLDDDFSAIPKAMSLGRRIYGNLRKAMSFILAVHVPIAGLAIAPLLLGWPVLLGPIHIAFLEMVIDPVCSLAFEAEGEESDAMSRPPRDPNEPLFTGHMIGWSSLQGLLALAVVAAVFAVAQLNGLSAEEVRVATFLTLVFAIVCMIFVNRVGGVSLTDAFTRANAALTAVLAVVFVTMGMALTWAPALALFQFAPLQATQVLYCAGAGLLLLVLLTISKRLDLATR